MTTRVSVIICTYNRDVYIRQSMESIANQDADRSLYELILVNNNSTDRTHEICSSFGNEHPGLQYKYHIESSQGLSYARNRGLHESSGDLVVYIDDDAFAERSFVSNMIRFYDLHPAVMGSGGRIIPQFEAGKPEWMSKFLMKLVAAVDLGEEAIPFPKALFPIGANMTVRRQIFNKIGEFDVNLGRKGKNLQGGEEKDIYVKMRELGHNPWYVPDTVVRHIIPASRMTKEFIRRQAHGIGYSEGIRVRTAGKHATMQRYFTELVKWGSTFLLFIYYSVQLKFAKAIMLFRFRTWVSRGLFLGREG
jgi:glucosyl-dolichyl phosphate glucuronosyltransferase